MRLQFLVVVGGEGFGEQLAGLADLAAGEAFLVHFAVFFGQLEIALGKGETGAHGHFVVIEAFAERLDDSVGALVDGDFEGLFLVGDG